MPPKKRTRSPKSSPTNSSVSDDRLADSIMRSLEAEMRKATTEEAVVPRKRQKPSVSISPEGMEMVSIGPGRRVWTNPEYAKEQEKAKAASQLPEWFIPFDTSVNIGLVDTTKTPTQKKKPVHHGGRAFGRNSRSSSPRGRRRSPSSSTERRIARLTGDDRPFMQNLLSEATDEDVDDPLIDYLRDESPSPPRMPRGHYHEQCQLIDGHLWIWVAGEWVEVDARPENVPELDEGQPGARVGDLRRVEDQIYRWDGNQWLHLREHAVMQLFGQNPTAAAGKFKNLKGGRRTPRRRRGDRPFEEIQQRYSHRRVPEVDRDTHRAIQDRFDQYSHNLSSPPQTDDETESDISSSSSSSSSRASSRASSRSSSRSGNRTPPRYRAVIDENGEPHYVPAFADPLLSFDNIRIGSVVDHRIPDMDDPEEVENIAHAEMDNGGIQNVPRGVGDIVRHLSQYFIWDGDNWERILPDQIRYLYYNGVDRIYDVLGGFVDLSQAYIGPSSTGDAGSGKFGDLLYKKYGIKAKPVSKERAAAIQNALKKARGGKAISTKPHLVKGSKAAKERMAWVRSHKGN